MEYKSTSKKNMDAKLVMAQLYNYVSFEVSGVSRRKDTGVLLKSHAEI
jgi:hypothetical protein